MLTTPTGPPMELATAPWLACGDTYTPRHFTFYIKNCLFGRYMAGHTCWDPAREPATSTSSTSPARRPHLHLHLPAGGVHLHLPSQITSHPNKLGIHFTLSTSHLTLVDNQQLMFHMAINQSEILGTASELFSHLITSTHKQVSLKKKED